VVISGHFGVFGPNRSFWVLFGSLLGPFLGPFSWSRIWYPKCLNYDQLIEGYSHGWLLPSNRGPKSDPKRVPKVVISGHFGIFGVFGVFGRFWVILGLFGVFGPFLGSFSIDFMPNYMQMWFQPRRPIWGHFGSKSGHFGVFGASRTPGSWVTFGSLPGTPFGSLSGTPIWPLSVRIDVKWGSNFWGPFWVLFGRFWAQNTTFR
jgi:hypothetical protein